MKPKLIIGNKNYSSWSLRPWLLLKEAGIEFDEHRIVLDVPTTQQEIASYSAAGRVPILQLGDLTVRRIKGRTDPVKTQNLRFGQGYYIRQVSALRLNSRAGIAV